MNIDEFKAMGKVELFGVDGCAFAIRRVRGIRQFFEAVEDESDGYRSCLAEVRELTSAEVQSRELVFQATPIVRATARDAAGIDGIEFADADGHVWLVFGTDNADDYYPSFIFTWTPKAVAK